MRTFLALLFVAALSAGQALAEGDEALWAELSDDLYPGRAMADASGIIELEAPYRAHDAAIVPISIRALIPQSEERYIRHITLVIDENPAPVAAVFTLGPGSGEATITTRVRVNSYSKVHAIAELDDGSLYVAERFVKASGGCSAPALKDQDAALAGLGELRLKRFDGEKSTAGGGLVREALVKIRHPNYTGFQMDPITRYYIPPHFVSDIEVREGEELVLKMEGGISLSEDPTIRFHYRPESGEPLTVTVKDTEQNVFTGAWPAESAEPSS